MAEDRWTADQDSRRTRSSSDSVPTSETRQSAPSSGERRNHAAGTGKGADTARTTAPSRPAGSTGQSSPYSYKPHEPVERKAQPHQREAQARKETLQSRNSPQSRSEAQRRPQGAQSQARDPQTRRAQSAQGAQSAGTNSRNARSSQEARPYGAGSRQSTASSTRSQNAQPQNRSRQTSASGSSRPSAAQGSGHQEAPRRSAANGGPSSSAARQNQHPRQQGGRQGGNALTRALGAIGNGILYLLSLLGRFIRFLGSGLASLFRRSKAAFAVLVVVVVIALVGVVDFGTNYGRAYDGVSIGGLDVSGMTEEEIVELLDETYGELLESASATVYASEEAAAGEGADEEEVDAELLTAEEELASITSWEVSAEDLAAELPSEELAAEAVSVGRDDEGLAERIDAALNGREIDVYLSFGEDELEDFASTLDLTLGVERVDCNFVVEDGVATVTEGSDGYEVDRDELADQLEEIFLYSEDGCGSFVATVEYAAVRISEEEAQEVCDLVNAAIANGAQLLCNEGVLEISAEELGSWIVGEVEETEDGYELVPHVDESAAKSSIVAFATEYYTGEEMIVSFEKDDDGNVTVSVESSATIPLVDETTEALEEALFAENTGSAYSGEAPAVSISFGKAPDEMTVDEALDLGVIEVIASYTTTFSTGSSAANRNSNIALAAEYLNNSIVDPGESWSFNDVCGERTEERGFLAAGAIVYGEYGSDVGGGICQVATTIFNALYESGLPITERHAHSLYISSYPAGRDAAVSWPDLDLVWENDTDSSILLCVTCGDASLTATLYGVDPGYVVESEVGEWEEGEEYSTITEVDEDLEPGESYVETTGVNGRKISVTRLVYDSDGNLLREDVFSSTYGAVDEVIVVGPDSDEESEEEEETEEEETEETQETEEAKESEESAESQDAAANEEESSSEDAAASEDASSGENSGSGDDAAASSDADEADSSEDESSADESSSSTEDSSAATSDGEDASDSSEDESSESASADSGASEVSTSDDAAASAEESTG